MSKRPLVPLERLAPGARGIISDIQGGAEFMGRVAAMGLTKGASVEILQNRGHGPLLVRARDTRIALGRGEALKILLEEVAHGPSA